MKLYVLIRSLADAEPRLTYQLLQTACQAQGVELVSIEQEKMVFDENSKRLIEPGSAFYRLSTGPAQILAEQLLVRADLSTIYEPWRLPPLGSAWTDTVLMFHKDLPIIPTTFLFASLPQPDIEAAIEKLGGYPIVVKYTGLSHGQGVFLCVNYQDVETAITKTPKAKYNQLALRRFIKEAVHLRTVVIGHEVADVIKYRQPADDFRTNAGPVPTAEPYDAPPEIRQLAVEAAQAYGVKLAGIDILLDHTGKAWLAEVNTPCNYARNYMTNGKNLAENLVKMLTTTD